MSEINDGGPAYPEPFFYMVNSMSTQKELQAMARELSYQCRDMPKGISLRDVLVGQAITGITIGWYAMAMQKMAKGTSIGPEPGKFAEPLIDWAESIADEYLSRRAKRKEEECPASSSAMAAESG